MTPTEEAKFTSDLISFHPLAKTVARSFAYPHGLSDIEDFIQDAMLAAWQHRNSFKPGTNLKAWFICILRNKIIAYKRRAWRMITSDFQNIRNEIDDHSIVFSAEQEDQYYLKEVISFLKTLPERQQNYLLRTALGDQYKQVAATFSQAEGTVKSNVARGREHLAEILDYDGVNAHGKQFPHKRQRATAKKRKFKKTSDQCYQL